MIDASSQRRALQAALRRAFGGKCVVFDGFSAFPWRGSLRGITLSASGSAPMQREQEAGGVLFHIGWTDSAMAQELRQRAAPVQAIYLAEHLCGEIRAFLLEESNAFSRPVAEEVAANLGRFWILMARLPAVINRAEHLAAHALLSEMRALLIDLVVALNGASRPRSPARINQYLGTAQRDAFEKCLGMGRSAYSAGQTHASSWIGQAVALIVLYRWYAPQLAEIHAAAYPQDVEEAVLNLLREEIDGWPAHITTG